MIINVNHFNPYYNFNPYYDTAFEDWLIQSFIKDNHPKYRDYVALWFRNLTFEQKEGFKAQYERAMYNSLIL